MLLPKAIQYYRSFRNRPASKIQPLNRQTSYALWILLVTGLIALLSTLSIFSPENIFLKTDSYPLTRSQILLTRLSKFNPPTESQERLVQILEDGGKFAAQLYAQYGPDVLLNNPLSLPDQLNSGRWFLLYAAPSILVPHLLHLFALGAATSGFISGKEGARWRNIAIVAGLAIIGLEFYLIQTYDLAANTRGAKPREISYIHWTVRTWRGVAIATVDAVLGLMIWLQATGRAFVTPDSPVEATAQQIKHLETLLQKIGTLGIARNGTMRDAGLRGKVNDYWVKEQEAMTDILQQPEVVQAQRQVVASKDMGAVSRDAAQYVDRLL